MPLSHRECTRGYELHDTQGKNQPFNVHGQHQTAKKENELGKLIQAMSIRIVTI